MKFWSESGHNQVWIFKKIQEKHHFLMIGNHPKSQKNQKGHEQERTAIS